MPSMDPDVALDHLARETQRARAVLGETAPDATVPACPDWTASDLAWHLGVEVQDFWRHVVEHRPAPPEDYQEPERPTDHASVIAIFDRCHEPFMAALRAADPGDEAWTWTTEQTVGFTMRRQALEALVHRVDAEQAAGLDPSPIDPLLAADGVDEVLDLFYGGNPPWGSFEPDGGVVRVALTDVGSDVWVRTGRFSGTHPRTGDDVDEVDLRVVAEVAGTADAVVSGTAVDVFLWLWDRGDDAGIVVTGDPSPVETFRQIVAQPLD